MNWFSQLADAVIWILQTKYNMSHSTNYLDDYFIAGPAASKVCNDNLNVAIAVFAKLGIPLAPEKIVSPCTLITYLGIIINTENMKLCLTEDKISELDKLHRSFL